MSEPENPRKAQGDGENPTQPVPVMLPGAHSLSSLIREFFVDVLGSLVPGLLFTLVATALVVSSGMCFLRAFGPDGHDTPALDALLRSQTDTSRAWFLLIVAYVVGGIFHRQDPKRPDQRSLERILRGSSKSELKRSAVQEIDSPQTEPSRYWSTRIWLLKILDGIVRPSNKKIGRAEAAAIAASSGAQFPYSHIRKYLEARGLNHLAGIVPWTGAEGQEHRTKMFLNVLKVRLQLVAADKCGEMVRNEAHVRMMSSVWYAARAVYGVCWLSALAVLAAVLQSGRGLAGPYAQDVLVYGALMSFAAISAFWLQRHVESCFHYQRVREVVYVLETAFSVCQSGHTEILEHLPVIKNESTPDSPPPSSGHNVGTGCSLASTD